MNNQPAILREWQDRGVELKELDDHTLELYYNGILIARFSSLGVTQLSITEELNSNRIRKEVN